MPTPTPTPSALTTKVKGQVFSEDGVSLAAVTVNAAYTNGAPIGSALADGSGNYSFDSLPSDQSITLTTSLSGYSPRSQTFSPIGSEMVVDFKGDNAVTNRPEIIAVSPADGATGVTPKTPIELVFSTTVDQSSVTGAFAIQYDSSTPFSLPVGLNLPGADWPPVPTTSVYDASNFTTTWTSGTRVTLMPRSPLPTTTSGGVPTYRITMNYQGRTLKTPEGRLARESVFTSERNVGPFNLGRLRAFSRFTVANTPSSVLKLSNGTVGGTRIRLQFNEPMFAEMLNGRLAGGADGMVSSAAGAVGSVTAAQASANYEVEINGGAAVGFNTLAGAKAYFDDSDVERRTVLLECDNPIAPAGQTVVVRLKSQVRDPLGRTMVLNGSDNKLNLTSFGG